MEHPHHLLLKCIAGSKAYGLDLPGSDTDIKGVFVLPRDLFYGLEYVKQVQNESNDIVFYELKRFFELLSVNNPGMLELLAMPAACILYKHPLFDALHPRLFLSKLCHSTFAGYAFSQIKRAKGLNKKILNPMAEERLTVLDFCYVVKDHGSIPLPQWLELNRFKQEHCGLVNIAHMKDVYAIFHDNTTAHSATEPTSGFRGIIRKEDANGVSLSHIPKGKKPVGIMSFNKEAYSKYCRDHNEYWDWVNKRNENRYKDTIAHGKNYDAKNMMHTFRLLDMAEEIARTGEIIVKRPNRDPLLEIRQGKFLYNDLVEKAEARVIEIEQLYKNCNLPDEPDKNEINQLLIDIRKKFYSDHL